MNPDALARRRTAAAARVREIVTPEGIPIRFELAGAGDRAGAFLLDMLFQILAIAALLLCLTMATGLRDGSFLTPIVILVAFLVLNFYFAFFEIRGQGATPGKRRLGIRVIDARGGQLENGAVLARNLVRELEVWMPLRFLLGGKVVGAGAPGWALLLAGAWTFVFLLMPLFNKDRLRIGDLIAGTRVVMQPKVLLAPDLVDERAEQAAARAGQGGYEFTEQQLGFYGIYELQVLEGLLRQNAGTTGYLQAIAAVTEKIQHKIGYEGPIADSERFLRDFYAAQRAHLEQRMLFGQRREDKHAR
ncbi:MAG TPA: RDD family protein [Kofleriaceae bacterium]|nr:RDD family protein [Kofleriaceae bacterium]